MADIVEAARERNRLSGNAQPTWVVTLVNGKELVGTIEWLAPGCHALNSHGMIYYFSTDKVIHIRLGS